MQQQDNHEYPFLYQRQTCTKANQIKQLIRNGRNASLQRTFKKSFTSFSHSISENVNFCVMEAIKLCRLDTPIIFIEARINLSRFVVTGCAAKTSATVTFPSLNLISLFAFCFNIWLNGVAS